MHCATDGGPQFRSFEFTEFLKKNEVNHSFSPPYNPDTNGAAENFVQTFKNKVKKLIKEGDSTENALNMFLSDYRNFPHCTTGRSPANLMFNQDPRTRFDCFRPSVSENVDKQQRRQIMSRPGSRNIAVGVGDEVLIDGYGVRDEKKIPGEVVRISAPSTMVVKAADTGKVHKRHLDQVIELPLRRSARIQSKKGEEL